ncbi:MAG: hypothetical protein FJW20_21735 [Acidimicrobiia bacterium]|nr:hypothetical protein [Acidimicrobiia bacterium]
MTGAAFEVFLARLYTDAELRRRFLDDPTGEASRAGLSAEETQSLEGIDRLGLELAAESYRRKRVRRQTGP